MNYFGLINQKPITNIRLSEKYLFSHPSEIAIKYNTIKYKIRTAIAIIFFIFCILGAWVQWNKEKPEYFLIIVFLVELVLGYFIFFNLIRALNKTPIIVINDFGIKIKERPTLNWKSVNAIHIKEYNSEEGIDYNLCVESENFKWEEDFTSFNLSMEEISHWLAYFKQKHTENWRK